MKDLKKNLEDFIQDSGFFNKMIMKGVILINQDGKIKKYSPSYFALGYVGGIMLPSDQKNFELATGITSKEQTNINSLVNIIGPNLILFGFDFTKKFFYKDSNTTLNYVEDKGMIVTSLLTVANSTRIYYNLFKDIQSAEISILSLVLNSPSVIKRAKNYKTKILNYFINNHYN